jgi:hypothetical protein
MNLIGRDGRTDAQTTLSGTGSEASKNSEDLAHAAHLQEANFSAQGSEEGEMSRQSSIDLNRRGLHRVMIMLPSGLGLGEGGVQGAGTPPFGANMPCTPRPGTGGTVIPYCLAVLFYEWAREKKMVPSDGGFLTPQLRRASVMAGLREDYCQKKLKRRVVTTTPFDHTPPEKRLQP